MWLSQQIIDAQKQRPAADSVRVTGANAASGASDYRALPFAGPWGICYLPPNAAEAVVVTTNAGSVCVGAVAGTHGIEPGELLLYSSGGAEIYLKNNGEVEINGKVFAAKGGL